MNFVEDYFDESPGIHIQRVAALNDYVVVYFVDNRFYQEEFEYVSLSRKLFYSHF